jgi:hypothetical protein
VPFTLRNIKQDLENIVSTFDGAPEAAAIRRRGG